MACILVISVQVVLLNSAGVSELIERFRNVHRSLIPELPRNDVNFRRRFEFYQVRTAFQYCLILLWKNYELLNRITLSALTLKLCKMATILPSILSRVIKPIYLQPVERELLNHFEHSMNPGKPLIIFSQSVINNGEILDVSPSSETRCSLGILWNFQQGWQEITRGWKIASRDREINAMNNNTGHYRSVLRRNYVRARFRNEVETTVSFQLEWRPRSQLWYAYS